MKNKTGNIKAVIFDMDGLMIDSKPIQSIAFETITLNYVDKIIKHPTGIIQTPGFREKENWEDIMKRHNFKEDIDVLSNKRKQIYSKLLKSYANEQPGLKNLLKLLKKHKIKMAVASSSSIEHINIALEKLSISIYFDAITSGKQVPRGKPFPDTFISAAKKLNALPKDCVVLEDAENGVLAGKRAGMKVIAIPNKYTHKHDFSKADIIAKSLSDISLELLESL